MHSRIPRTLTAVLAGAALAVAGAGMQGISRNPLGDPGLLGLTAGAAAAVVLAIAVLGSVTTWQLTLAALAGSAAVAVLVFGAARLGGSAPTPAGLVLSGAAVGAGFTAATTSVVLTLPAVLDRFRFWSTGSVARAEASDLAGVAPLVLGGLALVLAGSPGLNALALGEELAQGLGVHLGLQRGLVFAGVVALSGAATALTRGRTSIVACALVGAVLVVSSDGLGADLFPRTELPAGVVTGAVGAPIMLWLLVRQRRGAVA